MRRPSVKVMLVWLLAFAPIAEAAGPADDLLKLVPIDSGLTLAVEDLRGQSREILGSPLFEGLRRLPTVNAWLASDRFRSVERAARDIQRALGVSLATLRDEILGDAFLLTLQQAPSGRPDESQGLLLVKPRDRPLIERLLKALNDAQLRDGELAGVEARSKGTVRYSVRLFKAAGRPPEYYVLLEGGELAWSNSEAMILGVIDRRASGGPGLGDDPSFRKVRRGLPDRALASLFVNPRLLEHAMADAPRPADDRAAAMLARYVAAVGQAGLALQWRDGLTLHSHETLATEKLDPWLKHWLGRPPSPVVLPSQVSSATVALLSANLDYQAVRDALWELVPEGDRPSLENLRLGLQGILLGQDPLTEVLPRLGPGTLLALEIEPDRVARPRFPLVGVVGWSDQPGVEGPSAAIDNAMRTFLAVYALDPKRRAAHLRVESRSIGDARVTLLTNGLRTLEAYRVDRNRLVVGNSSEAVARFGTGPPSPIFSGLRAKFFPEAETFAIIDLARLIEEVRSLRGPFAFALAARSKRPVAATDRDLGDLIAVAELFQAATFTSAASKDASEIHRTIRLIAR